MGARLDNIRDPRQRQMQREGIRQRQEQIRQRQAREEASARQEQAQARAQEGNPDSIAPLSSSVLEERRRLEEARRSGSGYFDREKFNKVASVLGRPDFDTVMRKANQAGSIEELERMKRADAEKRDRQRQDAQRQRQRQMQMQRARAEMGERMRSRGTFFGPGRAGRDRDMQAYQQMLNRFRGGFR